MSTWDDSWGPQTEIGKWVYATKYFPNESYKSGISRVAGALADDDAHRRRFRDMLARQEVLPGGRVMNAAGAVRDTTALNCFVMDTIPDSMEGIMRIAREAAFTMKMGGGVGYDFSTLRPRGALIRSLDSQSSGPLSFMEVFNALCGTIRSAGHRRGAQMGVLRVDHPDIEEFIEAKTNHHNLTNFNISVACTNEFMDAVEHDRAFELRFDGQVYRTVKARALWDKIMRATWDWAEPGVLFIDRINSKNNLWYCETIAATNPCGEQPLPPYAACLLGSINLAKLVRPWKGGYAFEEEKFRHIIPDYVRALDNVIDTSDYPLEAQRAYHKATRRMGVGLTGLANASEIMGAPYGSSDMLEFTDMVWRVLRDTAYRSSISLAMEKGPFEKFDPRILHSTYMLSMPSDIREDIGKYGLRNSHLLSQAPTGTTSLGADNVSSGIEPVYELSSERTVQTFDGPKQVLVEDYAYATTGICGKTTEEVTLDEHVAVLNISSKYVDSAVSKTINVGGHVSWDDFKNVYWQAWKGGASGCTTFRKDGERMSIFKKKEEKEEANEETVVEGAACYIDPETGIKTCED